MLKIGSSQSVKADGFFAGEEAAQGAISQTGGRADVAIVFATANYDQEKVLLGVKKAAGKGLLVGCSCLRGIIDDHGLDEGVVVMSIASDKISFRAGSSFMAKEDPLLAGKTLAKQIIDEKSKAAIVFLESVGVNGSAIIRGIQSASRKNLPIIGGSASDASTFTKTYQYCDDKVFNNAVVGLGLAGDFSFGMGVQHGWQAVGLPVLVTKSEGSVIQEINNKPAIRFFEEYFGEEEAKQLYKPLSRICYVYPLGMSVEGNEELLIRNAFVANEKGEIICAGEIPQGSRIRLMLGDTEKAIVAASNAAKSAKEQLGAAKPKAVLVFNCAARFMLLGKKVDEEIKAIKDVFGKDVPLVGFYTYGEQAPLGGNIGEKCYSLFHNETMTLVAIGE